MKETWFTADTHFWHTNIIYYCDRPFISVGHMNHDLVENWNSVVKPGDIVYHIGDVLLPRRRSKDEIKKLLNSLNGDIVVILGNHDSRRLLNKTSRLLWHKQTHKLLIDGQVVTLSHYIWHPKVDIRLHEGDWLLHGHHHGMKGHEYGRIDVGVDCWDYTPISWEQVKSIMAELKG